MNRFIKTYIYLVQIYIFKSIELFCADRSAQKNLFNREHNRIASILGAMNKNWTDEIIYQVARKIAVAEIQHITYNEFIPLLTGNKSLLPVANNSFWVNGYNPEVYSH